MFKRHSIFPLIAAVWLSLVVFNLGPTTANGDEVGALGGDAQTVASLPGRVRVTMVDHPVIHYATFQSHNQKVVEAGGLIFLSHIRSRNDAYTDQCWRLSISRDGGSSFVTLVEQTGATNPPVLECDRRGNLYLVRVDFVGGDAYLDRWDVTKIKLWLESQQATRPTPQTTRIPGGAAGKYAAVIDPSRDQLYFFSHNNTFHRLRLDGTLIDSRQLMVSGPNGLLQYPHLSLNQQGQLHLAWTTQKHGEYMYRDIHYAISEDGGDSFFTWLPAGDGGRAKLELPIVADETGPALRVTLDDEFEVHTWLASGLATTEHWHGFYQAQTTPPRQHYVRYDLKTGAKQIDRYPKVSGQCLNLSGLDGFFAHNPSDPQRLFVIGNDSGHLACLVSDDAGATWRDYARSEQSFGLYSIGGYRQTTEDGEVIGSFTDHQTPEGISDRKSKVYFFRIEAADR
ncbi:MAG: hypothetical protein O2931_17520 [Planctomycetota bacterium]|nr:hypothetical protein [Planctomycetota bacterium]MDA1180581.1 hypothetical protein [Planctomycetota bacterium]